METQACSPAAVILASLPIQAAEAARGLRVVAQAAPQLPIHGIESVQSHIYRNSETTPAPNTKKGNFETWGTGRFAISASFAGRKSKSPPLHD
ncbi:MAG: hypothetical protein ACYTGL_12880 [Planctomycetota bacterium]